MGQGTMPAAGRRLLPTVFIVLAAGAMAACMPPPDGPPFSLAGLPVADMASVPAPAYAGASALAAAGGSPVDIALAIAGPFEGTAQHIIQMNEGGEAPVSTRITVLRDGLLDDSVRGERWDIVLDRARPDGWTIREVRRAWRCRRGGDPERFTAALCP